MNRIVCHDSNPLSHQVSAPDHVVDGHPKACRSRMRRSGLQRLTSPPRRGRWRRTRPRRAPYARRPAGQRMCVIGLCPDPRAYLGNWFSRGVITSLTTHLGGRFLGATVSLSGRRSPDPGSDVARKWRSGERVPVWPSPLACPVRFLVLAWRSSRRPPQPSGKSEAKRPWRHPHGELSDGRTEDGLSACSCSCYSRRDADHSGRRTRG